MFLARIDLNLLILKSGKFKHQNLRFIEKETRILCPSLFSFFITASALRFNSISFFSNSAHDRFANMSGSADKAHKLGQIAYGKLRYEMIISPLFLSSRNFGLDFFVRLSDFTFYSYYYNFADF